MSGRHGQPDTGQTHTESGPWPYQKNHRALWERSRSHGRWATRVGGRSRRQQGRENKRVKPVWTAGEILLRLLLAGVRGGHRSRMGGSQLRLLESLSLGCADHQAQSTGPEVEGQGREPTSYITALGVRGGVRTGEVSAGRESCARDLGLVSLDTGGCTWGGAGPQSLLRQDERGGARPTCPMGRGPPSCTWWGPHGTLTSKVHLTEGRHCRTRPAGLVQVTVLCFEGLHRALQNGPGGFSAFQKMGSGHSSSLRCQGHCQWARGANQNKLPSSSRLVSKSTCALVAWNGIRRGQAAQPAVTRV